jgi:hypothetical protein
MNKTSFERGQAMILIVFGMIALVAITGLAVDGGMAYNNRRTAQNTADSAAMAAALAFARGNDPIAVGLSAANANGFDNNGTTNAVNVTQAAAAHCPHGATGKDITVQITSHANTYFGSVLGIRQLTNSVQAVSESCSSSGLPSFNGNAIVALTATSTGFNAQGDPSWNIVGGGIFSNSSSASSAHCGGNAGVNSPSATVVGGASFGCSGAHVAKITTGVHQYSYAEFSSVLPRVPSCNGTASQVGGMWTAQSGKDGSRVAWNGSMNFAAGLYCVTNSPGSFHGSITGSGVTFYIMPTQFVLRLDGMGSIAATAPTSGEFAGVLIFSAPQECATGLLLNQTIDFRGNGTGDVTGSVIVPSATVTMYGNSNSKGFHTQIIAYNVDTGGNSSNQITYNSSENFNTGYPAWVTLLK